MTTTQYDHKVWNAVSAALDVVIRGKGKLGKTNTIHNMVNEMWTNYMVGYDDLSQDILLYYFEKDLHAKWNGKSKLITYINTIVYYYLSNELKKRRWFNYNDERVERKPKDALDVNRQKLESLDRFVDENDEEGYSGIEEYDFFHNPTPEDHWMEYEYNQEMDRIFDEIDQQVIYGETTMSGAAKKLNLSYHTYYMRLQKKRRDVEKYIK